jgi:glycosyltransferase involved in cell wall biosynthesis
MDSLIVSPISPPVAGRDVYGIHQRLGLFVGALGRISTRVHLLHFVPPSWPEFDMDPQRLAAEQSAYWGTEVSVSLVPTAVRRETFRTHYVDGVWSAFQQPDFYRFCGPDQVAALARATATASQPPDIVFMHRLAAMGPLLTGGQRPARLFFDLDDIEHKTRFRAAMQPPHWPGKLVYAAHALALIPAEARAIRRSQATFVCSEQDRRHLQRLGLGKSVHVVPNAIRMPADPAIAADALPAGKRLLYIGNYEYEPNQRAAERLVVRIWPLIRARHPDATLTIAGKGPERLGCFGAPPPGVMFTGFVPSVEALYAETRVVCCPLLTGGGTRLKLIEAAGFGKAMVSTHIGAEGLDFREGAEILLRDDDASFAEACSTLLEDDAACRRLGSAARARAVALYDVAAVQDRIISLLQ